MRCAAFLRSRTILKLAASICIHTVDWSLLIPCPQASLWHCAVVQGLEVAIQTQREPVWATHFGNANHFNIQRCGATAARPGGRRLMMSPQRRWSLWRGPSTPSRKRSFGIGEARLTVSLAPLSTRKPVWRLQNNLRLVRSGIVRAYFPMHIMFH
jgi:hypothetical protein